MRHPRFIPLFCALALPSLFCAAARAQEKTPEAAPSAAVSQVIKPREDGKIVLHASAAKIHGATLRYEPEPHKDTLGYWTNKDDTASWEFEIPEAGRYRLSLLVGCGNGSGGSLVHVRLDEKTIPFIVRETGGFQNFKPVKLGEHVLAAGRHRLALEPQTKPGLAVMDARQATLEPRTYDRWEKEISEILERDAKNPPPAEGVVFAGSSSIRLWNLKESFPDLPAANRGFGGSCVADSTHFADRLILPLRPKFIVFYAGDNDSAEGLSAEQIAADFEEFTKRIHASLPECRILFLPIKPSLSRWKLRPLQADANARIQKYCESDPARLRYVDTATPMLNTPDGTPDPALFEKDGLHLSKTGYALWNGIVKEALAAPFPGKP